MIFGVTIMPSKRSRQQVKITRQKISTVIILILLLLIFLFFLSFSIRNMIICNHINSKDLKEYSGTYTIRKSHRLRNTIYFISLENGDVLRIAPELLKNGDDFTELSALHFTYSEPEFGLTSTYTCVGISSTNGVECYLEIEDSLNEATTGITTGILISVLILALAILVFSSFLVVYHSKKT